MRRLILLACLLLALPVPAAQAARAPTAEQLMAADIAPLPGTPSGQAGTYSLPGYPSWAAWRSDDGSILAVQVDRDVEILQGRTVTELNDVSVSTTTMPTRGAAARSFQLRTGLDATTFVPAGAAPAAAPYALRLRHDPRWVAGVTTSSSYGRRLAPLRRAFPGGVTFGTSVHGLPLAGASIGRDRTKGFRPTDTGLYEAVWYGAVDASQSSVGPQISILAAHRGTGMARGNAAFLHRHPDMQVAGLAVTLTRDGAAVFRRGDLVVAVSAQDWTPTRTEWRAMLRQLR